MNEEKPESGNTPAETQTPKKKLGRPRRDQSQRENALKTQKTAGSIRKPRRQKTNGEWMMVTDGDFVGRQVHGVLDGFFDAGYLLTVKVGDSQTILRGLVFDPSLSVPVTTANDIAPNVKLTKREEESVPITEEQPALVSPLAGCSFAILEEQADANVHAIQNTSIQDQELTHSPEPQTCDLVQDMPVVSSNVTGSSNIVTSPQPKDNNMPALSCNVIDSSNIVTIPQSKDNNMPALSCNVIDSSNIVTIPQSMDNNMPALSCNVIDSSNIVTIPQPKDSNITVLSSTVIESSNTMPSSRLKDNDMPVLSSNVIESSNIVTSPRQKEPDLSSNMIDSTNIVTIPQPKYDNMLVLSSNVIDSTDIVTSNQPKESDSQQREVQAQDVKESVS